MRRSIEPTYDSRETGERYNITVWVNDHAELFQRPIDCPFVRQSVTIGWWYALKSLLTFTPIKVEMCMSGDKEIIEDVLELDANYLGDGTRRQEFNGQIQKALESL